MAATGALPKLHMIRQWVSGDGRIYFMQTDQAHWYPQLTLKPIQRSLWEKDSQALTKLARRYPQGFASRAATEKALAACYHPPLADRRLGRALLHFWPVRWAHATRLGRYLYHMGTPTPTAACRKHHGWQCGDLPYQLVRELYTDEWQVQLMPDRAPCSPEFYQVFANVYFTTRTEALVALTAWRNTILTKNLSYT